MKMAVSFGLAAQLYMLFGLCCYLCAAQDTGTGSVSTTNCNAGGTECDSITNSACESSKCKCNPGFKENANACTKVLGGNCSGATDCTTPVSNSECSSKSKCACATGFMESNGLCVTRSVSTTDCNAGGTECDSITNSVCGGSKCKCNPGFKENPNACTKILGGGCSVAGDCTTTVPNSECSSKSKCACASGFMESNGLCVTRNVSQTDCTAGGTQCSSIANSACGGSKCKCNQGFNESTNTCSKVLGASCKIASDCSTTVPNSNCSSTTCACIALYVEKENMCVKSVSGTTCTKSGNECNSITNSACDVPNKKCKCNSGFKENVNTCAAESKASMLSTKTPTVMFAATLLSFVFRNLF